jgi:hypothetical protein
VTPADPGQSRNVRDTVGFEPHRHDAGRSRNVRDPGPNEAGQAQRAGALCLSVVARLHASVAAVAGPALQPFRSGAQESI